MEFVVSKTGAVDGYGRAVSLDAVKSYLDVLHNDDDTDITALIDAATEYIERVTPGLVIVPSSYSMLLSCLADSFELPRWPLHTDDADPVVQYRPDGGGELTTHSNYDVITPERVPAKLILQPEYSQPSLNTDLNFPVVVTWNAGYTTAPKTVQHAIKLLVRHWYDNRDAVVVGTISTGVGRSLDSLLRMLRPGHVAGVHWS